MLLPFPGSSTICAIATPPGEGAIGIIRLSGPEAIQVADRVFRNQPQGGLGSVETHTLHHGRIVNPQTGKVLDEVMVAVLRAPRTYTKEDTVEINTHGGPLVMQRILEVILRQGAQMATPGEFTKRAFLNGRIDLSQAEAVMDLIQAKTDDAHRMAMEQLEGRVDREIRGLRDQLTTTLATIEALIDFPEEDLGPDYRPGCIKQVYQCRDRIQALLSTAEQGRLLRDGLKTVIVGRPNVGKSSLLNLLLNSDRAIVSATPGTTRDLIEEHLNIDGLYLRIIDTAGLRSSNDAVEQEGVRRAKGAIERGDLILLVVDATEGLRSTEQELLSGGLSGKRVILVINKVDVAPENGEAIHKMMKGKLPSICLSATQGLGQDDLREALKKMGSSASGREDEGLFIAHLRHKMALEEALRNLDQALEGLEKEQSEEIIAIDLRGALDGLGEIIGSTTNEEVLNRIFQDFCIGK